MFMYRYSYSIPRTYTKQNERHIAFILPLEIGDFDTRIKQKRFFDSTGYFSCRTLQMYVFFLTMQRSENIIPSKILFFKRYVRKIFVVFFN